MDSQDSNGNTPLLLACSQSHLETIKLLLKKDAGVDCRTDLGATPLMFCAQTGMEEAVKLLIGK